jgi:hypothetical protein
LDELPPVSSFFIWIHLQGQDLAPATYDTHFVLKLKQMLKHDFIPRIAGKKTVFLSHLYFKTIILPRQARDKHRETALKKETSPFSCRHLWGVLAVGR